jgi:GDPmannose 4,6-dehydratase
LAFEGEQENETAKIVACNNPAYQVPVGSVVVEVDSRYFRPTEVELLIGDPTKAKEKLGRELDYDLPKLVDEMVLADVKLFEK